MVEIPDKVRQVIDAYIKSLQLHQIMFSSSGNPIIPVGISNHHFHITRKHLDIRIFCMLLLHIAIIIS